MQYLRLDVLLQAGVPGFLQGCHSVTEGLLPPPEYLIWDEVQPFKRFPQEMLLHTILLRSNKLFSQITETTNVNVEKKWLIIFTFLACKMPFSIILKTSNFGSWFMCIFAVKSLDLNFKTESKNNYKSSR